jgi:hypothetical protein
MCRRPAIDTFLPMEDGKNRADDADNADDWQNPAAQKTVKATKPKIKPEH